MYCVQCSVPWDTKIKATSYPSSCHFLRAGCTCKCAENGPVYFVLALVLGGSRQHLLTTRHAEAHRRCLASQLLASYSKYWEQNYKQRRIWTQICGTPLSPPITTHTWKEQSTQAVSAQILLRTTEVSCPQPFINPTALLKFSFLKSSTSPPLLTSTLQVEVTFMLKASVPTQEKDRGWDTPKGRTRNLFRTEANSVSQLYHP